MRQQVRLCTCDRVSGYGHGGISTMCRDWSQCATCDGHYQLTLVLVAQNLAGKGLLTPAIQAVLTEEMAFCPPIELAEWVDDPDESEVTA